MKLKKIDTKKIKNNCKKKRKNQIKKLLGKTPFAKSYGFMESHLW